MFRQVVFVILTLIVIIPLLTTVRGVDYPVSGVISSTLKNGDGSAAIETKLSQDSANQVGTTFYGPNNPVIYTDLMASVDSSDRTCGCVGVGNLLVNITITDSSGTELPGARFLSTAALDSPHDACSPSPCQDYLTILTDLYNYLADVAGLPSAPTLTSGAPFTAFLPTGTGAQWQWEGAFPCCTLAYDKGLAFRYQPNFPHPDVYTIHVLAVETAEAYTSTEYVTTVSTPLDYSFQYVYESDANSGNDAGSSFSTATGISIGSYNGFMHGADTVDMYKFDGFAGQTIYYNLVPPLSADFGATFYDPGLTMINGAGGDPGTGKTLYGSFTPSSTGSFYEKIYLTSGSGTYSFGLSTSPFPPGIQLSANPSSVLVCPSDAHASSMVTVTSLNGFSGSVSMSGSPYDSTLATFSAWPQWAAITIPLGGSATDSFNLVGGNNPFPQPGAYTFTLTGTSGSITGSTPVTMNVSGMNPCCLNQNGCGGGGGSVADGTLITMSDGSRVPVQNLNVGDAMLGFNTTTGQFTTSIVKSIKVVETTNQLIIHTSSGTPFRVDANPHQTLWIKTETGAIGWVPVTQITIGDSLLTIDGWTPVTGIEYAPAGDHVMYDIASTSPYFASGYLDPITKT